MSPAERWKEEGFWVLEVKMDEDGRDLDLEEKENEGSWGWKKVLMEGREWLVGLEGVDETNAVGIVGELDSRC